MTNEARIQKMKDEGRDEYGNGSIVPAYHLVHEQHPQSICRYSKARRSASRELYDGP